ncbi:MAG: ribulokinase [Bacteroidaceae bacterium]|nr:ribulokinase [Bacteroidaceae bacterium]
MKDIYVLGIEFGTDSARALLVNAQNGEETDTEVALYPRWMAGKYTAKSIAQFRHHPADYIDALQQCVGGITSRHPELADRIAALSVDTTASTPCLVDKEATPLALKAEFADNPDAMFVVWKDHTGQQEADEINLLLSRQEVDYSLHSGRFYSVENFWCKVLHALRHSPELQREAYSAIEACDYIPALLTGCRNASSVKMGRCSAASKMMWAEEWGGYPPAEFFAKLDPLLLPILTHLPRQNYSCEEQAGTLTPEWAEKLGLRAGIPVGIGNVDAHSGGVGGGIRRGTMVLNLGTSACFMAVMPKEEMGDTIVEGIFGQAEGSILRGMTGFESGLSAFGDDFDWFRNLMAWPLRTIIGQDTSIDPATRRRIIETAEKQILEAAAREAEKLPITIHSPLATDWFNGRRCPYANNTLTASMEGLTLSTSAAEIYYAIAEATAFATKRCIEHYIHYGIAAERLIAIGGIARKSPFVVQLLSDAMNMPVEVPSCLQAGTLGAAIHAAVVAGLYPSVSEAQKVLCKPASLHYQPRAERHALLERRYARYESLGAFAEAEQKKAY